MLRLPSLSIVLLLPSAVLANDAWEIYVGSEKAVQPHPHIRMAQEYITMDVGERSAWVTCTFWFRNEGPKSKVKMAYPDEAYSTHEDGPYSQLRQFRSWVDGKRVSTRFRMIGQNGFQLKDVPFGAGQSRKVVNRYRMKLGSCASRDNFYVRMLSYTFSTGASWKGNIGRSKLIVRFNGRFQPIRLRSSELLEWESKGHFWPSRLQTLFTDGPQGKLVNGTYQILKHNWRPGEGDNMALKFRPFIVDWEHGEREHYLDTPEDPGYPWLPHR